MVETINYIKYETNIKFSNSMIYITVLYVVGMRERKIDKAANELISRIEPLLQKYKAERVILGGSYAKGTDVVGKDSDLDVFVLFKPPTNQTDLTEEDYNDYKERIIGLGNETLANDEHYTRFADLPFVEGYILGDVRVNIVFAFDVKRGECISAGDLSQHHVAQIANLPQKVKNDIKRLKVTFKQLEIYGASQKRQGFSGYYTELLVSHYGSYDNVLKGVSDLKSGTRLYETEISPDSDYRLSVFDPVYPKRNLSVALSDECLDKLILYTRGVTLKPDLPSVKIDLSKVTDDNEDEQTGRRRRELSKTKTKFNRAGFVVLKTELDGDYGVVYLESLTLSTKVRQNGPPLEKREACEAYLASRPDAYSENGRLYCLVNRTYTDANVLAAEY